MSEAEEHPSLEETSWPSDTQNQLLVPFTHISFQYLTTGTCDTRALPDYCKLSKRHPFASFSYFVAFSSEPEWLPTEKWLLASQTRSNHQVGVSMSTICVFWCVLPFCVLPLSRKLAGKCVVFDTNSETDVISLLSKICYNMESRSTNQLSSVRPTKTLRKFSIVLQAITCVILQR